LDSTVGELTAAIEQEARQRPEALRLMTHPGVGPITALAFVLIIGSPDRFASGKQIGSYLGLIPCEDSSADRQRLGHVTKQGSVLCCAFSSWRQLRLRFVGTPPGAVASCISPCVATAASPEWLARKLAVSLYWMWRKGYDYQQHLKFGSHAGEPGYVHGVK
jgi:hypothetical protein